MAIEYDREKKRWTTRVQIHGRRRRIYAKTQREVKGIIADLVAETRIDRYGQKVQIDPTLTFGEMVDRFLAQYPEKPQSRRALKDRLDYATRQFADVRAIDLTSETIQTWLNSLTTTQAKTPRALRPTSRRGILKAIRQVYAWALRAHLVTHNPAANVKAPTIDRDSAQPFESWDEVYAVADALGSPWGEMTVFWAATGLRPEEIISLRWSDVTLDEKPMLRVHRSFQNGKIVELAKNRHSLRTLPLPSLAVEALKSLPHPIDQEQLIFPGVMGGVLHLGAFRRRQWADALVDVGLTYRPPRHLRHTFATLALAHGASIETVSRMLGHASVTTTERHYARFIARVADRDAMVLDQAVPTSRWPNRGQNQDRHERKS